MLSVALRALFGRPVQTEPTLLEWYGSAKVTEWHERAAKNGPLAEYARKVTSVRKLKRAVNAVVMTSGLADEYPTEAALWEAISRENTRLYKQAVRCRDLPFSETRRCINLEANHRRRRENRIARSKAFYKRNGYTKATRRLLQEKWRSTAHVPFPASAKAIEAAQAFYEKHAGKYESLSLADHATIQDSGFPTIDMLERPQRGDPVSMSAAKVVGHGFEKVVARVMEHATKRARIVVVHKLLGKPTRVAIRADTDLEFYLSLLEVLLREVTVRSLETDPDGLVWIGTDLTRDIQILPTNPVKHPDGTTHALCYASPNFLELPKPTIEGPVVFGVYSDTVVLFGIKDDDVTKILLTPPAETE